MILFLANPGLAQQERPRDLVVPPGEALAIMIVSTLIAYNQGNATGNYTVLRDLASPEFRETNSPTRLADIFRDMRERAIDIAPIVLFPPKLIGDPRIDEDGDLILEGLFDTRPEQVNFFLVFRPVQGRWKLFAIRVTTTMVQVNAASATTTTPTSDAELEAHRSRFEQFDWADILKGPIEKVALPDASG